MPVPKMQTAELPTVATIKHYRGYEFGLEDELKPDMQTYELTIRSFITDVARIRVEKRSSIQIAPEIWRGVSVSLEVPCYVEEVDEARRSAMSYVNEHVRVEEQKILIGAAEYYRSGGEEKKLTERME